MDMLGGKVASGGSRRGMADAQDCRIDPCSRTHPCQSTYSGFIRTPLAEQHVASVGGDPVQYRHEVTRYP